VSSRNFIPDENVCHLAVDRVVAGRITSTIIKGGVINSDGVLSYREEDSRPYNPIHYDGTPVTRDFRAEMLRLFLLDYNPSMQRGVSYA
jgi:hypothetical protein